jgi:hypothetical protein
MKVGVADEACTMQKGEQEINNYVENPDGKRQLGKLWHE